MEKRKCYISYKMEDVKYKNAIVDKFGGDLFIDRSQDEFVDSNNFDTIMQDIRKNHLRDTSVTIFLIGRHSFENYRTNFDKIYGLDSQKFIRGEIKASLYNGNGNKRSGLLGVVLPEMEDAIYKKPYICPCCGKKINCVNINNNTVIKEFGQNYYLKKHDNSMCDHYSEDDRYAVLVRYKDFMNSPREYIEKAFNKREQPIAEEVRVRKFEE